MSTQDNRFDGVLMSIIQQKGNIDLFFDTVFGFLRRNTDFFANQKKAEQIIVGSCKNNFDKFTKDQTEKKKEQDKKKQEAQRKRKVKQVKEKLEKEKKQQVQPQKGTEMIPESSKTNEVEKKGDSADKKEDEEPAPKGNGGRTEKYIWTQTLEGLEMFIFLPDNVSKKEIKVSIGVSRLIVTVKGQTLIDGEWKDKINLEESEYWVLMDGQLEDYKGKYLHLTIEKWKNQMSWWSTPIKGDPEINTQKINPEPSKMSELDPETRSTVDKMRFDMMRKQQGLPTSDQMQKQEKMQEFMKAHPELDFSQCKMN